MIRPSESRPGSCGKYTRGISFCKLNGRTDLPSALNLAATVWRSVHVISDVGASCSAFPQKLLLSTSGKVTRAHCYRGWKIGQLPVRGDRLRVECERVSMLRLRFGKSRGASRPRRELIVISRQSGPSSKRRVARIVSLPRNNRAFRNWHFEIEYPLRLLNIDETRRRERSRRGEEDATTFDFRHVLFIFQQVCLLYWNWVQEHSGKSAEDGVLERNMNIWANKLFKAGS